MPELLYFTEDDVRRLLPMRECIAAMRKCFDALARGEAINQPRRRLILPTEAMLHSMAGCFGAYFGTKIYSTHPKHGAHFTFLLYDAATAKPLAQFEANHLGQIRTGAVTGYAIDKLTRPQVRTLGILGSGFQARTQVEAALVVRSIQVVKVYSRRDANRQRFAGEISEKYGVFTVVCDSAEEVLHDADIVVTATFSKTPLFDHGWGTGPPLLVAAMGSNRPDRRELPGEMVLSANVLVADDVEQARIEAGDFLLALGPEGWNRVQPLSTVNGPAEGLAIFKSVGLGVEDVAAAAHVYEKSTLAR